MNQISLAEAEIVKSETPQERRAGIGWLLTFGLGVVGAALIAPLPLQAAWKELAAFDVTQPTHVPLAVIALAGVILAFTLGGALIDRLLNADRQGGEAHGAGFAIMAAAAAFASGLPLPLLWGLGAGGVIWVLAYLFAIEERLKAIGELLSEDEPDEADLHAAPQTERSDSDL